MTQQPTDTQRWAAVHTDMAKRADALAQRNGELTLALQFATRYVAKAVADGLMEDCAVPASVALQRLEAVLETAQGRAGV